MSSNIELYDSNNIDTLVWPNTVDGHYAEIFLAPLVKNGVSHYIDNIHADVYVLKIDNLVLPIVLVNENYANSWVCSPYAHYISYGKESVDIIGKAFLAKLMKNFITILEKISRSSKMNSVVYVNNWMFSTDLYPDEIHSEQISDIVKYLTHRFPFHAIIMRSLNKITTPDLMSTVNKSGFHLIASRYVFITDSKNDSIFKTRILKSDLKLWKESSYQIINEDKLKAADCELLLDLYRKLYVIQHSPLQPQFNHDFFKMLINRQLLRFKILKADGIIKGVAGFYKRNNVMMCPIFGYEKNSSESNVIYRLLNTALLLEAQKEGLLFNQSAGAAFFKSIRRAEGSLEYMAIYTEHLPMSRKLFWSALKFIINRVGSKYMQKY